MYWSLKKVFTRDAVCQNFQASQSVKFASLSKTKDCPFDFYGRSQPKTDIIWKKSNWKYFCSVQVLNTMPWSSVWIDEVVFSGKNTSSMHCNPLSSISWAEQWSNSKQTFFLCFCNQASNYSNNSLKIVAVIQEFLLDLYVIRSFFIPLKQHGLAIFLWQMAVTCLNHPCLQ